MTILPTGGVESGVAGLTCSETLNIIIIIIIIITIIITITKLR